MKFATLSDAIDYYRKLANENPDNPVIINTLGDLFVKSGDKKRALDEYKRAMKLLEEKASYQNALAIAKKILRYVGKDIETIIKISRLYTKIGEYDEAVRFVSILNPEELSEAQSEEVAGLVNFLLSSAGTPDVKLRLTKLYNALREKIGNLIDTGEDFSLGSEEEMYSEDVPPLLAETPLKIGDETIIDLSIPGETGDFSRESVDPDFLKTVIKKLSENKYVQFPVNYEMLDTLIKGGFYKEALWLLHNTSFEERNGFNWKKILVKCLVETESKEEIRNTIEDFETIEMDAESIYYIGRAYELIDNQEMALKYYLKTKTYFGNYRDVYKRIQNLRSGKV